jgi:N-glycosylase/DNA lyase
MEKIIRAIEKLKKADVRKLVDERIQGFKNIKSDEFFDEMCFCILTANFTADRSIEIQKKIGKGFCCLPEKKLAQKLRQFGHRFPNARARYIAEARKSKEKLAQAMNGLKGAELRNWLVQNIKGLGYKEASHFLRNIGYDDYAIIDFHIIDLLEKHRIIERPKTLTHKKYLEIESVLKKLAEKTRLTLAELDLYMWYMETGKVLK